MEEKNETFCYEYSARQQEEIEEIRQKYLPRGEDKMERLRKLDQSVTKHGTAVALIVGVISSLILGLGMSCVTVWAGVWFLPGVIIGVIGLLGIASAYPLYQYITKKQREKVATQIIQLTEELMK